MNHFAQPRSTKMKLQPGRALLAGLAASLALVACKSKEPTAAPSASTKAAVKEAPGLPQHTVFAASNQVRVVDTRAGKVVGQVPLQKAVREIRFSADGATAYVAASDGVRAIDSRTHEVVAKLSDNPTRYIELSPDGSKLYALEHFVLSKADGSPDPQPFSLLTIDTKTGQVVNKEQIGERIIYARPAPSKDGRSVYIEESGKIVLGTEGGKWGQGTEVDLRAGMPADKAYRVRKTIAHFGQHVFVPIEGEVARVLDIDTASGQTRLLSLGSAAAIRGLGITPDGRQLLVNTGVALRTLDVASGQVVGEALQLPAGQMGCAVSDDGRFAYLAQMRDKAGGPGGAVVAVDLKARSITHTVHLDNISPWAIAVAPTTKLAAR